MVKATYEHSSVDGIITNGSNNGLQKFVVCVFLIHLLILQRKQSNFAKVSQLLGGAVGVMEGVPYSQLSSLSIHSLLLVK